MTIKLLDRVDADVVTYAGEDLTLIVAVYAPGSTTIQPVPDCTVKMLIGTKRTLVTVAQITGALVTDGNDGLITASISKAVSAAIAPKKYDMQFIVTDAGGDEQVVYDGTIMFDTRLPAP